MTLFWARLEAVLLTLGALGLAVFLWVTRERVTDLDRAGRETNLLPYFREDAVVAIRIERPSSSSAPLVLRRRPGSPDRHDFVLGDAADPNEGASVDPAEAGKLLSTLGFAHFLRRIEPELATPELTGLSQPRLLVEVDLGHGLERLRVGKEAQAPRGASYVEVESESDGAERRVGVVDGSFLVQLSKDERELLGRLLLPHGQNQTKRLELRDPSGHLVLASDALGFRLLASTRAGIAVPPDPSREAHAPRADRNRVEGLFFQLARAKFDAFPPGQTPDPKDGLVIRQVPHVGAATEIVLGGPCPGHPEMVQVLRTAPDRLAGCTTASLGGLLSGDYVFRGLLPVHADEIDHLVLEREAVTLDLIRDQGAFRLLAPSARSVTLERGNDYLESLCNAVLEAAEDRSPRAPIGRLRAMVHPPLGTTSTELELALFADSGQLLVRREDDGALLRAGDLASAEVSWLLDARSTWYESLDVLDVPRSNLEKLEISGAGLVTEVVTRNGEDFVLAGGAVDENLFDELLRTLSPLRAARWMRPPSETGQEPLLSLRVTDRHGATRTLRVGARVRGGYVSQLDDRTGAFVLSGPVVRVLETSLQSRAPAQFNPDAFLDLTITARGVTYSFERRGRDLVARDGTPPELGQALVEALSVLQPLAAVRSAPLPRLAPRGLAPGDRVSHDGATLAFSGTYDPGGGPPFRLSATIFGDASFQDRPARFLVTDRSPTTYYVDQRTVLSILDLL